MDSKQSELIERYQDSILKNQDHKDDDLNDEIDDDELLDLLDEDDAILSQYRESRIQQLTKEFKKIDELSPDNLGAIEDYTDEKALMEVVTKSEIVFIHFYQPNFAKCNKMNEKLKILAEKHLTLKVLSIKAETATFLVEKLKIKVLPFVVIYKNGKEFDRLVGFEKLGNDPNDFSYDSLETYLIRTGVINRRSIKFTSTKPSSFNDNNDNDEGSDLDI
ncbi:phosducin-like protein 1 [[Candida] jaroonii]|uniref:Phosducin-like protein 1 n=1 Tax=[Candida] jaroonii TaxID=467808 RepID=A0ACA9Y009_9ASCO|nr:phosducin-like protein 1 [[Candida] jaroonii]